MFAGVFHAMIECDCSVLLSSTTFAAILSTLKKILSTFTGKVERLKQRKERKCNEEIRTCPEKIHIYKENIRWSVHVRVTLYIYLCNFLPLHVYQEVKLGLAEISLSLILEDTVGVCTT